jgi:DNA-binding transcriptional LysR family regulator
MAGRQLAAQASIAPSFKLEEELDAELFVRGNKKMLLSPAGQNFLSYARRILSLAEEAKLALHLNARGDIGLRATKLFRRLSDALRFGHQFKDQ